MLELRNLIQQELEANPTLELEQTEPTIEDKRAEAEEFDQEFERLATRYGEKVDKVRREFERADQVPAVRSDIRKRKALDWLVDHVEIVDEAGQPIDRADLELISEPEQEPE